MGGYKLFIKKKIFVLYTFIMNSLKNIKILYIEDEQLIRDDAMEYLSFYSDFIYEAVDGYDGFEKYKQIKPDIIICDIIMPRLNGLELIEKIRAEDKDTQIIVATARIDTEFLIKAVELRLVKYLTKPIIGEKLLNALNEALELMQDDNSNIFEISDSFRFDTLNKTLFEKNTIIKLPKKELLFLELLIKNHKRAVKYEELNNYVWNGEMSEDALRTIVKELRRKISKQNIKNISGIGYQIGID